MGELDSVRRTGTVRDNGPKAQDESASDELPKAVGRALNSSTNQDDETPYKDAWTSTVYVRDVGHKGERGKLSQVVDDKDDTSGGATAVKTKGLLVRLHRVDSSHERTI